MYLFNKDTIAAFASAPSSGAVALLRISGPSAIGALKQITKRESFKPRAAVLVKIYDGAEVLDTALATVFPAPGSYTGEDIVEITLHASPYIKARVLEILAALGARPARAGEFTMRAFLNGKMDLAQAQGVADLIASKNKAAHKAAVDTLSGKLSHRFKAIRDNLADLLAQIEVRIDDTDGELPPLDSKTAAHTLQNIIKETQELSATYSSGRLVKEGVKAAIIGVPNSGKSSLLNALAGYDRAIVSPESGTTRDTVEAGFDINGLSIILTDTAGIRSHSVDPAEKEGMRRSRAAAQNADIIIFVLDSAAPDAALQQNLLEETKKTNKKIITVHNKSDLPGFKPAPGALQTCCLTGAGIEELKQAVAKEAGLAALQEDGLLITSAVHYNALLSAAKELEAAQKKLTDLELAAEHLRRALLALKELIGEVTPDDVLDIIFSKFCVGK